MPIAFETDGPGHSDLRLLLRGSAFLLMVAALVVWMMAESTGRLAEKVSVTGMLNQIGDGLPQKSDVKFRGVLVGVVTGVTPSSGDGPNQVHIDLRPEFAAGIPDTVTARVVPSNVFAVSSVQLVDNGPGHAIRPGARIAQDESLATVQFQTALSELRDIIAAMGRHSSDDTVGVISALAQATDRHGADLVRAGAQLERIVGALNSVVTAPGDGKSTVQTFSHAVQGLAQSAPDLLDALHHAVVPLRTVAEQDAELTRFLAAGMSTAGTIATAFENNTDRMITISTDLTPVIGVLADNSEHLAPVGRRLTTVVNKFFAEVYDPETGRVQSKMILSLSPNRPYTRADCPRYGDMAGSSCSTAPESAPAQGALPPVMDPSNFRLPDGYAPPTGAIGGNVGPVGSPEELGRLGRILGEPASSAAAILLGPLLRGNVVTVEPAPDGGGR